MEEAEGVAALFFGQEMGEIYRKKMAGIAAKAYGDLVTAFLAEDDKTPPRFSTSRRDFVVKTIFYVAASVFREAVSFTTKEIA